MIVPYSNKVCSRTLATPPPVIRDGDYLDDRTIPGNRPPAPRIELRLRLPHNAQSTGLNLKAVNTADVFGTQSFSTVVILSFRC